MNTTESSEQPGRRERERKNVPATIASGVLLVVVSVVLFALAIVAFALFVTGLYCIAGGALAAFQSVATGCLFVGVGLICVALGVAIGLVAIWLRRVAFRGIARLKAGRGSSQATGKTWTPGRRRGRLARILRIIMAALFVLGLVLAAIGLATGASRRIQMTSRGLQLGGANIVYIKKSDLNTKAFTNVSLDIPATWTQVVFEHGDSYGYTIDLPSATKRDFDCTVDNETLTVKPRDTSSLSDQNVIKLGEVNLDWTNQGYTEGKIVVRVPRGVQFDAVRLNLAAGDYNIGEVSARHVTVTCPAGSTRLGQITASRVALSVQGGSMRCSGISTTTLIETVTSGELVSLNSDAGVASLHVTTGALRFTGDASKQMTVKASAGAATLALTRPRAAYALTCDSTAGSVEVDGMSAGGLHEEANPGLTTLAATATTGSVNLNFK